MRLHVKEHGSGDRVAVFIHGFSDDHTTWWRLWPELTAHGYRVFLPDLRGFGISPRSADYNAKEWAADLVESLPTGADVVAGHSLGGRLLALAVDALAPQRAVYLDPAWAVPAEMADLTAMEAYVDQARRSTPERIRELNPRWNERDLAVELSSFAAMDPATVSALPELAATPIEPGPPGRPSLVVLADPSPLVPDDMRARLREQGYELRTVPGAGHVMHRDDFRGFMTALEGWI